MARMPLADMSAWPSLSLEGNLIAPPMVAKIDRREATEQSEESYGVRKGLTIREEISLAFRVGQAHFDTFAKLGAPSPEATRRFVRDFLKETLGFTDLADESGVVACISGGQRVPVVVVPPAEALDRRSPTLSIDRSRSPTFALQDYLNEHDEAIWGLATNGTHLRLLRDNASLTRPAHIEADLAQIFANEDAASFAALWLIIHRSRFGAAGTPATDCALERWRDTGAREGEAARDRLAGQVEIALRVLGSGFLEANPDFAEQLRSGALSLTTWFNELLRLVYRLIFLMVAEDRNLLHPASAGKDARQLYADGYSLAALRAQCVRGATWDRHQDRYEGMKIVFRALAAGEDVLGLPALGGLFGADQLPHLDSCRLRNRVFMEAVYRLSWLEDRSGMVPVNWRAMETEELGSVYESLLELQPQLADDGRTFAFASDLSEQKGNQRKTTGSYYTPDSLVQALLDTALDPVLERTEAEADDPAEALLRLAVIDPACGSGHFLLAAARRIATRVARIRAEGTPSLADFRHALRDAARRCIHGVDRNPMAVELTKVALWIETVDPGLPLGFFDDQIRCGDALLGVFDLAVLEEGIPDAAYKPLTGDDKAVARHYARKNKRERTERSHIEEGFRFSRQRDLMRDFAAMRAMPEDTLDQIAAKAARLAALTDQGTVRWVLARACDLYVAAFLAPKITLATTAGPDGLPRRAAETVPTAGTLWELLRGREPHGLLVQNAAGALEGARAFHWPLEFPDIMVRGGFDIVVGNPPYLSALEHTKSENTRSRHFIQRHFSSAKGAFDIYIPFIERGAALARAGTSSLLTPNKYLSAPYGQALRKHIIEFNLLTSIDDFSRGSYFTDANVYPLISTLRANNSVDRLIRVRRYAESGFTETKVPAILTNRLPDHNFGPLLSEDLDRLYRILEISVPFADVAEINASTTAAEAEIYTEALTEESECSDAHWRVVNTGTIDPFISLWGLRPMRHAKEDYQRPVLSKKSVIISERRKHQYDRPKLFFAKIGNVTEAFFDEHGVYAGLNVNFAFVTGDVGKFLTSYVNSTLGSWVYRQLFGALTMSGGYLQYQSPQIRTFPIPKYEEDNQRHRAIVEAYDELLSSSGTVDEINSLVVSALGV